MYLIILCYLMCSFFSLHLRQTFWWHDRISCWCLNSWPIHIVFIVKPAFLLNEKNSCDFVWSENKCKSLTRNNCFFNNNGVLSIFCRKLSVWNTKNDSLDRFLKMQRFSKICRHSRFIIWACLVINVKFLIRNKMFMI